MFKSFVKSLLTLMLVLGVANAATKPFVIKSLHRDNAKPRYTITVNYPVFVRGDKAKVMNKVVQSQVDKRISTMQTSFQNRGGNGRHQSEFSADVAVLNYTDGHYSIIWLETAYFSGAMHPLTRSQILNYNANLNQPMKLTDLVNASPDFYSRLSTLCRQSLRQQIKADEKTALIDPQWFNRGTAPNKKNFSIWAFTPQSLQIVFPEYSIAPYAAGRFVVSVPWSELDDFKLR